GPFNELVTRVMDPYQHMWNHVAAGTRVWVRRRRVPLTPEQSARLTTFASSHEGKPFALARGLSFMSPFSRRGLVRTPFVGRVHGDRPRYFCSELVVECLVAAGLMDGGTARPAATLPRDLFFGRSGNPYLDRHLDMEPGWYPPARWLPGPPGGKGPSPPGRIDVRAGSVSVAARRAARVPSGRTPDDWPSRAVGCARRTPGGDPRIHSHSLIELFQNRRAKRANRGIDGPSSAACGPPVGPSVRIRTGYPRGPG